MSLGHYPIWDRNAIATYEITAIGRDGDNVYSANVMAVMISFK